MAREVTNDGKEFYVSSFRIPWSCKERADELGIMNFNQFLGIAADAMLTKIETRRKRMNPNTQDDETVSIMPPQGME